MSKLCGDPNQYDYPIGEVVRKANSLLCDDFDGDLVVAKVVRLLVERWKGERKGRQYLECDLDYVASKLTEIVYVIMDR